MRIVLGLVIVAALGALAGCGNGLPVGDALGSAQDVFIVAHQDDDLLFMQPDVGDDVAYRTGVTTVYVTAGDDGRGKAYAEQRVAAAKAAYQSVTNDDSWKCGYIELAGHSAEHCRVNAENVSLVFLGYPDGGVDGSAAHSLLQLWEGNIASATTIADRTTSYDQQGLIDALAVVITAAQPQNVHALEIASTHGDDHSDHMLAGALALLATAEAGSTAELVSYRGYNTDDEPANRPPDLMTAVQGMLTAYGEDGIASDNQAWLARRYAVGFRLAVAGALRTGGQCLLVESDGSLVMGDCASAPAWHSDAMGELGDGTGHCLDVLPTGEITYDACSGGSSHHFFVDDEGHVWASIIPAAAPDMSYAHLACLTTGGGRIHASLCGQGGAPTWDFVPAAVQTPRATLGFTATGRAVRLADVNKDGKADLCTVAQSVLTCALGDGTGGFAPATTLTNPFAVDPQSLAISSTTIGGAGSIIACGLALDGSGPQCALASSSGGTPQPWNPQFAGTPVTGTAPSFAISGDGTAMSALTSLGVEYASNVLRTPATVATWPTAGSVVWTAPLDQDAIYDSPPYEDFCVASPTGPLCAPADEPALTGSDGVPWGFSLAGVPDPSPQDANTGALADIDGDGRADLCSLNLANSRVACARSQGRGFGPRTTLFALPAGVVPTALWLGDLNGDGKADACVDAGATIVCALSP